MTVLETALLVAMLVGILVLVLGQIATARALRETSSAVTAALRRIDGELVPLLRESRDTVTAARDLVATVREVAVAAQEVGPVLRDVRPVIAAAGEAVGEAATTMRDAQVTLAEARLTLTRTRATIVRADAVLRKLGLGELAVDFLKSRAGGIGSVAAGVGGLVKSVWQKRPRDESEPHSAESGKETADGTERAFGE